MNHHHHHHHHHSNHYRESLQKNLETWFTSSEEMKDTLDLITQLSAQQATHQPSLFPRHLFIFMGDHGVAKEHHQTPTTESCMAPWLNENSPLLSLLNNSQTKMTLANVGCSEFSLNSPYLHNKPMRNETRNWRNEKALSIPQVKQAMRIGADLVAKKMSEGINVFVFSSKGRGQNLTHTVLAALLLSIPVDEIRKKHSEPIPDWVYVTIQEYQERTQPPQPTPVQFLSWFGGLETAAMTGAIIQAASHHGIIFLDDFPSLVAACLASPMDAHVQKALLTASNANSYLHQQILSRLEKKPMFHFSFPTHIPIGSLIAFSFLDPYLDLCNGSSSI